MSDNNPQDQSASASQEEMKHSEAYLRRAELIANMGHWELDLQTNKLSASQGARRIYELTSDEKIDYEWVKQFTLPAYRSRVDELMRKLIEEGERYELTIKIKQPKSGAIKDLYIEGVYDQHKETIFGIVQDVTERRMMADRLEQSEHRYKSFFERNNVPMILIDPNTGDIIEANPAAATFYGYPRDVFHEMHINAINTLPPEIIKKKMRGARQGEQTEFEFIHRLADGSLREVRAYTSYLQIDNRDVLHTQIFDETDRKQAELERDQLLRELRERYKELNLLYRVAKIGADEEISLDELIQDTLDGIPASMQNPEHTCARIILEEREFKTDNYKSAGSQLTADIHTGDEHFGKIEVGRTNESEGEEIPFIKEERKLVDALGRLLGTIMHRKLSESKLLEERLLLRTVIENLPDAIYAKDRSYRKILANQADLDNIGKSEEEVLGKTDAEVFPAETAEVSMAEDRKVIDEGTPIYNKEQFFYNDQGEHLCLLTSKIPLKDNEGQIYGLVGIGRDITDRVQSEKKLRKSLEEKKILLAEVHHRVKNNLAIISGLLGLQMENWPHAGDVLIDAQNRIHSIAGVHELLYNNENFIKVDLQDYIEKLIQKISDSYINTDREVKLKTHIDDVELNVNQAIPFGLLINELINNSFKHAFKESDDGTITIKILKKNDQIRVEYSDNGIGFEEEDTNHKSLGFDLIHTLAGQIGAEDIEMHGKAGFHFCFEFESRDFEFKGSVISHQV